MQVTGFHQMLDYVNMAFVCGCRRDLFCNLDICSSTFFIVSCVTTPLAFIVQLRCLYQLVALTPL